MSFKHANKPHHYVPLPSPSHSVPIATSISAKNRRPSSNSRHCVAACKSTSTCCVSQPQALPPPMLSSPKCRAAYRPHKPTPLSKDGRREAGPDFPMIKSFSLVRPSPALISLLSTLPLKNPNNSSPNSSSQMRTSRRTPCPVLGRPT